MSIRVAPSRPRRRAAFGWSITARFAFIATLAGFLASPALAQSTKGGEPQLPRLTMANVEKLVVASRNMKALENDPEVLRWVEKKKAEEQAREESGSDDETRSDMDENLEKAAAMFREQPKIRKAIESSGLTIEQYFGTSLALGFAMMAHGMEKQAGTEQKVGSDVAGQNLLFVRQNDAKLTALMEELKKYEFKALSEDQSDDQESDEEEPEDPAL
jgi:hypothetical protein